LKEQKVVLVITVFQGKIMIAVKGAKLLLLSLFFNYKNNSKMPPENIFLMGH